MSAIVEIVNDTIEAWNRNLAERGYKYKIELIGGVKDQKYYLNKVDYYEKKIAELCLFKKGLERMETSFLLHRGFAYIAPQDLKRNIKKLEIEYLDPMYRSLLYECIGSFTILTEQKIVSQDYAEYDIEKGRLKQHDSAVDMVIKALENGPFWEKGNEFDVFLDDVDSEWYNVYTEHDIGKSNNGIAKVKKNLFMVTQAAKKSIILLK